MCVTLRLSVSTGRWWPCCSIAATGSTSTRRASTASFTSGQVIDWSSGFIIGSHTSACWPQGTGLPAPPQAEEGAWPSRGALAQCGRENAELLTVLGHRASRDTDPVVAGQLVGNVRVRKARVLAQNLTQHILGRQVGSEKVGHRQHARVREHCEFPV